MIDITPDTDQRQEVNVGDQVRISWLLDAQVNPDDLEFTVEEGAESEAVYSGAELTEYEVDKDGDTFYEYSVIHAVTRKVHFIEFALHDGVQSAVDTAILKSEPRLTD